MNQQLVLATAAVALAAVVLGAIILAVLAAGSGGPRRFALRRPERAVDTYIDRDASWAAAVTAESSQSADAVFALVTERPYLGRIPFVEGPNPRSDGRRVTRTPILAFEEDVMDQQRRVHTTVGTGISVPLVIASFAQRFRIEEGANGCRVEWAIAVTPRWIDWFPLRWTAFLARPAMRIALGWILRGA